MSGGDMPGPEDLLPGPHRSDLVDKVDRSSSKSGALPPLRQMDDGQLKTSARDEMPAISQSRSLPGRLQTSELLAFTNHNQLHAYDSIDEGEGRTSRSNSMLSKANSFTPRTASRKGESPAELPGVPTSVNADFQTQGEGGSEYDVSGHIAPLVRRSSQNKPGTSDVFRNFRVHPVFSNLVVNSRKGSSELDDTLITTLADEPSSDVNHTRLSKMLSLHKVHIASRNDTVVKLPVGGTEQPHDPSVHRMIFFRTKKELNELFLLPPVSLWERRFNRTVFTLIMLGVGDLAIETCDGPNYGSTDPGYPYLPTEQQHEVYDGVFAGLFTLEFLIRGIQAKSIRAVVHDPYMWLDLIGISPWYILEVLKAAGNTVGPGHFINMLRLIRLVRLALILRHYEQTKVMYLAIKASLRPLGITLFFLFTLVMIFATAIFYSEPCYNVETCTFTDIFNSAYFVMVTVATVGYGHQVPSLKNPGSLLLTMLVMILGQIYFSMPVAIIGNNFQLTYENFQMDKKKKSRYLNVSLSPFDCQTLHSHAKRLCDIQYHLLNSWTVLHHHIRGIARSNTRSSQSFTMDMLELEADRRAKIKEGVRRLLDIHTEASILLQVFIPHRRRSLHMNLDLHSQGLLSNMYAKAKKAIIKAKVKSGHMLAVVDPRSASQTLRGRLWLLLEVPDSSRLATIVNQAMVGIALVSVMLFFTESLQELAASGIETNGCRSVVKSYCTTTGFEEMDAACFLRYENGTSDFTEQLDFTCDTATESPTCYGNGLNFGSLNSSALACESAFSTTGVDYVCYRQQCRASFNMIFDMGPYWIYFEWLFGLVFTLELALRFYIAQDRMEFWKNFYVVFDVVAIVPFFAEVSGYMFAHIKPDYAIVATSPSFLSVIRVLKIMRILKLTRHFRGTKILASTAIKVWKPLVIPLFFLFTGCIIAGAVFYEIERGKECFVGEPCWWWGKNVLTPELAAGLPVGKRILIQDKVKTIITDMIHSTWLSYATLTSVGYGDLVPRTSIGKFFDVFVIIVATIYSAMPLSLVGSQFYSLYEKHLEKVVVKQGGSSVSWRTKTTISLVTQYKKTTKHHSARKPEPFMLSDEQLLVVHEFESMRRTILNLQRTLDAATVTTLESAQRKTSLSIRASRISVSSKASATSRRSVTLTQRAAGSIDQAIEQKSFAIMDTLLQFSQVVEKLQEAPADFEAFDGIEDDLHTNIFPNGISPRPTSNGELDTFHEME